MNTSAQKPTSVNMNTLIVTVDIGKATLSGYMRCQHPHVEVKPFDFANSLSGFKMFWEKIQAVSKKHNLDDIIVGIESTGCYGELLQHFLFGKPVRLVQVNPVHTKRAKERKDRMPDEMPCLTTCHFVPPLQRRGIMPHTMSRNTRKRQG